MYNNGLAAMDRVTTDLNQAKLESIRTEAKIQGQVPGSNIFTQIKAGISRLFTRKPVEGTNTGNQAVQLQELDCESLPTPC